MKNKYLTLIISLLALTLSSGTVFAESTISGHKIIIDAGHGGSDPGAMTCPGKPESVANLEVAFILQDLLESEGATVYMTRETDTYLTNRDRYTYANNETDGEILVSIHFNSSSDKSINYTQGLYAKWKKDINLASTIHQRLAQELDITDGGLLQFASGVILKADMPATIQEVAFISNELECLKLKDGAGERQKEIALSLFNGINDWFAGSVTPTKPGKRTR